MTLGISSTVIANFLGLYIDEPKATYLYASMIELSSLLGGITYGRQYNSKPYI